MKKIIILLFITLFCLSGCSHVQVAKKDQLILQVPEDIMVKPPTLEKL